MLDISKTTEHGLFSRSAWESLRALLALASLPAGILDWSEAFNGELSHPRDPGRNSIASVVYTWGAGHSSRISMNTLRYTLWCALTLVYLVSAL